MIDERLGDREWRLSHLYKIKDKDGNIVTFKPNRAQLEFDKKKHNKNIILKSRQLGFTTFEAIDALDEALFTVDRVVDNIIIGHNQEAIEDVFTNKIKFAWDNLPKEIRSMYKLASDSAKEMKFGMDSTSDPKVFNRVSVTSSARSGSPTRIHNTELSYLDQKYPARAEEVISGGLPSIPSNGRFDIESTPRGSTGIFANMCFQAMKKEESGQKLTTSDFKFHFFNWTYDDYGLSKLDDSTIEEVYSLITDDFFRYQDDLEKFQGIKLTRKEMAYYYLKFLELKDAGGGDPWMLLRQEYPTTAEEAFEASGSPLFNLNKLRDMEVNEHPRVDGLWHIFKEFNKSRIYTLGADVSEGIGGDSSAICIIDVTEGELVARYESNTIAPDMLAYEIAKGGRMYGECMVAPERNNHGHATISKLREIYPEDKIYKEIITDKKTDQKTDRFGWLTTLKTKPKILFDLAAIINEDFRIPDQLVLRELKTFPHEKLNQVKAKDDQTKHWDTVMALAIAWAIRAVSVKSALHKEKFVKHRNVNKSLIEKERLRRSGIKGY